MDWVQFPLGAGNFSSIPCPDRLWGTPNPLLNWHGAFFGTKRSGRDADQLSPPSSVVKEGLELYLHTLIYLHVSGTASHLPYVISHGTSLGLYIESNLAYVCENLGG